MAQVLLNQIWHGWMHVAGPVSCLNETVSIKIWTIFCLQTKSKPRRSRIVHFLSQFTHLMSTKQTVVPLTGFRVRARICAQVKTSLLAISRSRAISRISRSGAPFWKGECLGYNAKSNLCREAQVDIECRPFEVPRSVWQIHLA